MTNQNGKVMQASVCTACRIRIVDCVGMEITLDNECLLTRTTIDLHEIDLKNIRKQKQWEATARIPIMYEFIWTFMCWILSSSIRNRQISKIRFLRTFPALVTDLRNFYFYSWSNETVLRGMFISRKCYISRKCILIYQ